MRVLLAALVLGLALAASACGGSGSSSPSVAATTSSAPDAQAVVQAGQKSSDAGSARASFTASFTGAASGTMTGEGEFSKHEGHVTLDLSGLGNGTFGGGEAELVFSNLVYYVKLPENAGLPVPPGKEWFKIDLQKLGQTSGLDLDQLTQLGQSDPSQALLFLKGASDDFHEVGSEDVRGEPTTHYAGTIDLQKVAETAPPDVADQYRKLAQLAPSSKVPMDVWVGEDGLVRKLRFEQKLAEGSSMTMEEELYDYGADVDVSPPDDDEVIDLTDLIAQT
ncbi:MAG TPA: LppX_LprAFG lipoprotein [Gaiellaceae bacterium]|nr:LppX_LprAFG lipoprotein [Gaiellaceae bacterium]